MMPACLDEVNPVDAESSYRSGYLSGAERFAALDWDTHTPYELMEDVEQELFDEWESRKGIEWISTHEIEAFRLDGLYDAVLGGLNAWLDTEEDRDFTVGVSVWLDVTRYWEGRLNDPEYRDADGRRPVADYCDPPSLWDCVVTHTNYRQWVAENYRPSPPVPRFSEQPYDLVERRAIKYLDRMPEAISGQGGHSATYAAATSLVHGFGIEPQKALTILVDRYNPRCVPPWTEKELLHKVTDAATKPHDKPYLWLANTGLPEPRPPAVSASPLGAIPPEAVAERKPLIRPMPLTPAFLSKEHPKERDPIIVDMLRRGEVANVISTSKVGKSWLMNYFAFTVALGWKLFGTFQTRKGRVLIIDNELHPETIASRHRAVAGAMGLNLEDLGDSVAVEPLRGRLLDIFQMADYFDQLRYGEWDLIILDALYRFLSKDMSENDNAQMMQVYNRLDHYAAKTGAAFLLVHHSSKGEQGGKSITDVGSGAGSISRAADGHLVLRDHETPGCVVLDGKVRSWKPLEPIVLRWEFPVWVRADALDPTALKRPRSPNEERRDRENKADLDRIVAVLAKNPGISASKIGRLCRPTMDPRKVNRLLFGIEESIRRESAVISGHETELITLIE